MSNNKSQIEEVKEFFKGYSYNVTTSSGYHVDVSNLDHDFTIDASPGKDCTNEVEKIILEYFPEEGRESFFFDWVMLQERWLEILRLEDLERREQEEFEAA